MPPDLVYYPIVPVLIVAGTAIVLLLVDAVVKRRDEDRWQLALVLATIGGLFASMAMLAGLWEWDHESTVLGGMVAVDPFSVFAQYVIVVVAVLAALYGYRYFKRSGEAKGEFYPLLLFATSGMMLITSANDLIMVFVALELLSFSLYVLTGFSDRPASSEASMKYFLLGAFSSAFFLYGIALAYGATGTTKIAGIANALSGETASPALAIAAAGLLIVGFAFKVSAVPFHMWTPDAYQGAPTAVTAFMSAATKVAAFAALIRVLDVAFQPLAWDWTPVICVLAALTMVTGSLIAIAQTDIKRMLAYSSIAHAGFILVGLSAANSDGIRSALFYLVSYAAMILGAFGVVMLVSARGEENTSLDSYAGLGRRSPLLAGLMALFLLSLAGIPPTAGFIAKVAVFGAAVGAGHWPLVLIAVLASVVAAFFYIRVIVLMYMKEPEEATAPSAGAEAFVVAVPAFLTLLFGLFPGIVFGFLEKASVIRW
ncbi:MAG: NADH-quinone oxidoreductase subunit NuoN [Actinomycetota bacterium]